METFSALLALCAGNSPVTGEFPAQRSVTRSFDVFFDLSLNNGWANNRAAGDLRRRRAHYDVTVMYPQCGAVIKRKCSHCSPVRARYGVSFVDPASDCYSHSAQTSIQIEVCVTQWCRLVPLPAMYLIDQTGVRCWRWWSKVGLQQSRLPRT